MATRGAAQAVDADQPQYHVMPRSGWCNDVNGPIFLDGTYHMCAAARSRALLAGRPCRPC